MYYFNAAHASIQRLEPHGLGMGLDDGAVFKNTLEQMQLKLMKGDTLLFYTDGVTEARSPNGEEFGEERLIQAFAEAKEKNTLEIKKHLIHRIYTFFDGQSAYDDLTFIIVKVV